MDLRLFFVCDELKSYTLETFSKNNFMQVHKWQKQNTLTAVEKELKQQKRENLSKTLKPLV